MFSGELLEEFLDDLVEDERQSKLKELLLQR